MDLRDDPDNLDHELRDGADGISNNCVCVSVRFRLVCAIQGRGVIQDGAQTLDARDSNTGR